MNAVQRGRGKLL